jgi:hypothetical protein
LRFELCDKPTRAPLNRDTDLRRSEDIPMPTASDEALARS